MNGMDCRDFSALNGATFSKDFDLSQTNGYNTMQLRYISISFAMIWAGPSTEFAPAHMRALHACMHAVANILIFFSQSSVKA